MSDRELYQASLNDKAAEITRLRASNAELLAACEKAIHVWDHNVVYELIAGELEDIVPELRAAVAHAQEAPS